ncbi:serine hydrolase [Sneathiella sp. P13V-1]|uniref:serine hydrolase domain-containing protein n=1 Tax=Sneathiella sp. P13V-1 TaxID=2697366 RepID=UPI00187B6438|nr:serine hydrolase [Sneathiella sp. P13V-1]MBE7637113.1 serine hydrolase [Sneathiella sp. P13V-1]
MKKLEYNKIAVSAVLAGFVFPLTMSTDAFANKIDPGYNTGGYIEVGKTTPHELKAATSKQVLEKAPDILPSSIKEAVEKYMDDHPATTGFLLMQDGKILLEKYQSAGNEKAEFFSMSMGKSLNSMTVGKAYCNGAIKSLDMKAAQIVPEFGQSNYGRSSVRQLLMMSSGAYKPHKAGQPGFKHGIGWSPWYARPFTGASWPLRLGQETISSILWGDMWEAVLDKNVSAPGEKFSYKSGDSLSLSKIVERSTGKPLAAYFEEQIWSEIGAEAIAHWETDKDGTTIASSGFQATLRDWGRIANWTYEQRSKDDCFGKYLTEATTTQIPIKYRSSYKGYGYQWWTDNKIAPGFWALGYAGQMMAIDPESGKILIKFSYERTEGSGLEIFKIFKKWVR